MSTVDNNKVMGRPPPTLRDGGSSVGAIPHVRRIRTRQRKREEKIIIKKPVELEKVLGITVTSNASLATAPRTGKSILK